MTSNINHYKAIIIGGGISGLAAAQVLHQHQINFVILEARNRIGGRIETNRTGLAPYDLGASWAHDTLTNPLFDDILDQELLADFKKFDLYYDDQSPLYFGNEGKGPKYFSRHKIEQVVKEFEKFVEISYFEHIDKEDIDLRSILQQYVCKQGKLLTEEQVAFAPQLARHLELWHGIGWKEMSSKFGLVDNVGRNCFLRKGYDTVVKDIESKLDSSYILTNSVVKRLNRSKTPLTVELADGSTYSSNWVICTIPQSILQLETGEIGAIEWIPKLPATITESLDNMSWGKLGKIVFEFESPWWKHHDVDRFVALADPDYELVEAWKASINKCDKTKANIEESHQLLPKPWQFPVLVLNMYKISGVPSLLCFTQGDLTEYLEKHPKEAWNYMQPILSRLKQIDLDRNDDSLQTIGPVNTIVSQWTLDPFARGSYAACKPKNDPTDLVIHLERGLNNVRFAGEHTILDGAGAVHGAWMSGRREAHYILTKENIIEGEIQEW